MRPFALTLIVLAFATSAGCVGKLILASGSGTDGGGGADASVEIAVWTDAPGACPAGATQFDVTSLSDLQDATRGAGIHASDSPSACYLIHDGTYVQSGATLPIFITTGGASADARRIFVGQSRAGVIIKGRATIDVGVSHVQLSNLTLDLSGYAQAGAFSTLTVLGASDVRVDHLTFTGDCATGLMGGHVEVDGASDVVVEACLIEKFGHCADGGHEDHGVYLSSGSKVVIRNSEIRGNSSRGIQLYTHQGLSGGLDDITIELNRIHGNGHGDYEDGIVLNGGGTGLITNVAIQHNLFYGNYYSGIRSADVGYQAVSITQNTFFHNGNSNAGSGKSEVNIDSAGSGAETQFSRNIFVGGTQVVNNCYDAATRNYLIADNVMEGSVPSGAAGNCIAQVVTQDPMFTDPDGGDYHAQNPAVAGYGAYSL